MESRFIIMEEEMLRRLIREEFAQAIDARTRKTMEREENENVYLTTSEVMEITGYNRTTIQRKINQGILKPVRKSNRNMFNKQTILDLQAQGLIKRTKKKRLNQRV